MRLAFYSLVGMEARERDVALLHRAGVWPSKVQSDIGTVVVGGPLLEPLRRLEWSGWNAIRMIKGAKAKALASTAAALHSLDCLEIEDVKPAQNTALMATVAAVLGEYSVKDLIICCRAEVCTFPSLANVINGLRFSSGDVGERRRW